MDTKLSTQICYDEYLKTKNEDRNKLLGNPEVVFQSFAYDSSIIKALSIIEIVPTVTKVLDVGCGSGGSLLNFLKYEFQPENLFGIDILEERVAEGVSKYPNLALTLGDASKMGYESDFFNIVLESTMFLQLTDEDLARKIGAEMIRVTKPGGHLILADWRYGKPRDKRFSPMNRRRIAKLFQVGTATEVVGEYKGALVPPLGRFLSSKIPSLYFLVRSLAPFLVGQVTTVLRKK